MPKGLKLAVATKPVCVIEQLVRATLGLIELMLSSHRIQT